MKISKNLHEFDFRILRGLELEKRKFELMNFGMEMSLGTLSFVRETLENGKESHRFEKVDSRFDDSFSCDLLTRFE